MTLHLYYHIYPDLLLLSSSIFPPLFRFLLTSSVSFLHLRSTFLDASNVLFSFLTYLSFLFLRTFSFLRLFYLRFLLFILSIPFFLQYLPSPLPSQSYSFSCNYFFFLLIYSLFPIFFSPLYSLFPPFFPLRVPQYSFYFRYILSFFPPPSSYYHFSLFSFSLLIYFVPS